MPLRLAVLALAVVAAGCGGAGPSPSPRGDGTPGPTPGAFTPGELRLRLIDVLGPRWWCDPDEYPVGRDEQQSAIDRWNEIVEDGTGVFAAVLDRLGFTLGQDFDPSEQLAVYRLWKVAASISFEAVPSGDGYRFDYLARPVGGAAEGVHTIGLIAQAGEITVESRTTAGEPMCPICLARGTPIDTPAGPVPVERLRVGDAVWTVDGERRRAVVTVLAIGSMTAPASHRVIRLELADGRTLTASAGHPLADGRTLGELRVGDLLDESTVAWLAWLPYDGGRTFDILVSGETGVYLVDGIPIASTIRPAPVVPGN
ncbi:MAG TPA: Hint domain-containing protein [Candidatus Deferrimicrobiaceae bacterium]|nr:Hint domain-containing protein [Candidatus Deferrimicrobiaceae bacterium]